MQAVPHTIGDSSLQNMAYLEREEIVQEGIVEKGLRKAEFFIANRTDGAVAFGQTRELLGELDDRISASSDPVERRARQLIRDNTLVFGREIVLRPSRYHRDTFLRDAFLTRQYADSPLLDNAILDMIVKVRNQRTGYAPTSVFAFGRGGFQFPDESTFYSPILLFQAENENHVTPKDEHRLAAEHATQFLIGQVNYSTGFVFNQGQRRTYWADEVILPSCDVVAFKQGLAAVALKAAVTSGIISKSDSDYVKRVEEGYRKLAQEHSGRLPLSLATGWIDVSALYPEYLSLVLFGEKMLDDDVVKKTIASFAPPVPVEDEQQDLGLRVISDQANRYLEEKYFIHPQLPHVFMDRPGYYQNGGAWLIWDQAALSATRLHGISLDFLPSYIRNIFDEQHIVQTAFVDFDAPESIPTGKGKLESIDIEPARTGQTWMVSILDQQRRVVKLTGNMIMAGNNSYFA